MATMLGVRALVSAIPVVGLLLATGCGSTLEDGTYSFRSTGVRQDSCSAAPSEEIELPDGTLEAAGETVRVEFSGEGPLVPGLTGASGDKAFVGRFLPDKEVDRFIADATFDVIREIGGVSCFVFSHASMEARVADSTVFAGVLRIDYTRRSEAQPQCPVACVLEVGFEAALQGRD